MLSYAWPLRAVGGLLAVTCAIGFALARRDPGRCPHDWQLGYLQPGSLHHTGDHVTFVVIRHAGRSPAPARLVVSYDGVLPAMVCAGAEVAVEGELRSPLHYRAEHVHAYRDGPYDHCWENRCDRAAYRACRGPLRYE